MTEDELLTREMSYTRWDESCQDPYNPHYQCRRPVNHEGDHAAGFGEDRLRWAQEETPPGPCEACGVVRDAQGRCWWCDAPPEATS